MAYDADLTPLFKKCTDKDLDTIVQYIINEGGFTEDISSSNEYKLYAPKHTKYIDLIVDEIQRYGGDSIVNLFRGRGVRYREIVEDVADKVSVKYNNNMSTAKIEELIIANLTKKAWGKMTEEERIEFLKNANVDINKLDGGQIGLLLNEILMLPLFSGAAYRVTMPCVVHIAMLRMKYMNDLDL